MRKHQPISGLPGLDKARTGSSTNEEGEGAQGSKNGLQLHLDQAIVSLSNLGDGGHIS
jgi:hypothetical protein